MGKHRRPSAWQTHRLATRFATAAAVGAVTVTGTLVAMAAEPAPALTTDAATAVSAPAHPVGREALAASGFGPSGYGSSNAVASTAGASGSVAPALGTAPSEPQRQALSSTPALTQTLPSRTVLAEVAETERAKAERVAKRKAARTKALKRAALARKAKIASRSSGRLSADARTVLAVAASLQGASYARGGDGPNSFDCSGFTQYVFNKVGVSLPHSSAAQRGVARPISASEVRPGDLVFVYNGGGGRIGHVAIYAGPGVWYESQRYGRPVGKHGAWSSNVSYGRVL